MADGNMSGAWVSVVAGFFAGISEVLLGHPFDTVKTRMQTQAANDRMGDAATNRGPWQCAMAAIRRDGIIGLYRGLGAPLIQNALGVALLFGLMDWLRTNLGASIFAPGMFVLCCCIVGTLESILYCPFEHIKARLQVSHKKIHKRSAKGSRTPPPVEAPRAATEFLQAMREIVRGRGLQFLYYGFSLQLLKETTGNVALFGTYDGVLYLLGGDVGGQGRGASRHAHPELAPWWAVLPAGSLAGMAYYTIGYPFDTLKSRLQTDSLILPRYRGPLHCLLTSLREKKGWRELYCGLSVCLVRAVPGSAVQFIVFELVSSLLYGLSRLSHAVKVHLPLDLNHLVEVDYMS